MGDAERGRVRVAVLISVRGAIISLGGTSCCDGIDVFGLVATCVDDHTPATL